MQRSEGSSSRSGGNPSRDRRIFDSRSTQNRGNNPQRWAWAVTRAFMRPASETAPRNASVASCCWWGEALQPKYSALPLFKLHAVPTKPLSSTSQSQNLQLWYAFKSSFVVGSGSLNHCPE